MDAPRGARLVSEDAIILDKQWRVDDREVDFVLSDGEGGLRFVVGLPFNEHVLIDEDTLARQAQLAFARGLLAGDVEGGSLLWQETTAQFGDAEAVEPDADFYEPLDPGPL
jgi:hypothetical protein